MKLATDGELLFEHLEENLGPMEMRWRGKSGTQMPFEVFVFPGSSAKPRQSLVTFGLSAHDVEMPEHNATTLRLEFAICSTRLHDSKVLGALLFAVALEIFHTHSIPRTRVLAGSGPVLSNGNPQFKHLYVAFPLSFPPTFRICGKTEPPIHMVQIIPITSSEKAFIECKGYAEFEEKLRGLGDTILEFDSRPAAV
jgi:hypothetical protein